MTFAIGIETSESDQERYFRGLNEYHSKNWNLVEATKAFSFFEEGDGFRHFSLWFIGIFTDNGFIYILFISVILGYFFSHNLAYVLDEIKRTKVFFSKELLILVLLLFFTAPLHSILGVRFILGVHALIYCVLPFVFAGRTRRIWFIPLIPILFHFGLWPIVIVFFGAILSRKILIGQTRSLAVLYIISLLASTLLNSKSLSKIIDSPLLQNETEFVERSSGYWSDDKIEEYEGAGRNSKKNWYATSYKVFFKYNLVILVFLISFSKKFKIYKPTKELQYYILMLGIFFNALYQMPIIERFDWFFNFLICFFLILVFLDNRYLLKKYILISSPVLILFIVVSFRAAIYNVSFSTFFSNPIVAIFTIGNNSPINEAVKKLIGF
jgi:hypothetical protein